MLIEDEDDGNSMERTTPSAVMECHRTGPICSIPVYVHDDDDDGDDFTKAENLFKLRDVSDL
jgi:hypothetical protein